MTERELSCFLGNLFAELAPPCELAEDTAIVLCGRTIRGGYATVRITGDETWFDGDVADLAAARYGRCPNEAGCGAKKGGDTIWQKKNICLGTALKS
jgi:hypothetical protein